MYSVRTDLAIEAREIYKQEFKDTEEVPGIECDSDEADGIKITRVKITTEEGEKALSKKRGSYITIEIPDLAQNDAELFEKAAHVLSNELIKLVGDDENKVTLVAGLGNREITPDSLGPRVVSSLVVTRHLFHNLPESITEGMGSVCAMAPSVLGLTGIETGEILRGVSKRVDPDLIIAVDALAARDIGRVCTTIQIADTGISPGSGVGNRRQELNKESMGIPVIAIGVPMVVDAATIANDSIDKVIDALIENTEEGKEFYQILKNIDKDEKYKLISEVMPPKTGGLIVTPKDIDYIAERVSKIVANGINFSLHKNITAEEIASYVS
jgi:spore protease